MILILATIRRPLTLNLLKMTPKAMQLGTDSATFQLASGAKNARLNHPHRATIIHPWSEDECLCPVSLICEYIARIKNSKQ